jgi:hypothetical protein
VPALCASIPCGHHTTNTHHLVPARRTLLHTVILHMEVSECEKCARVTRRKVASAHGISACGAARALAISLTTGERGRHLCSAQPRFAPAQAPGRCAAGRTRRCTVGAPSAPSCEPLPQIQVVEHLGTGVVLAVHVDAVAPPFPSSPCRAPTRHTPADLRAAIPRLAANW